MSEGTKFHCFWSTVGETALAKGFCSGIGATKCPCVCRRTKLPGRGVRSEKVREIAGDELEKKL